MKSLLATFLPLVVCGALAGCLAPAGTGAVAPQTIPADAPLLTKVLLSNPDIASARARALADQYLIQAAQAAAAPQVTANGGAGLELDNRGTGDLVPLVSVNAVQIIDDGGRITAATTRAALQAEQSALDVALVADQFLQELLTQMIRRDSASRVVQLIDANLARYQNRRPLIDAAIAAGIMTNADVLEIAALQNSIQSTRLTAQSTVIESDLVLDSLMVGFDRQLVMQVLRDRFHTRRDHSLRRGPAPVRDQAALQQRIAQAGFAQEVASVQPTTSFRTSLSAPIDDQGGVNAFVGIDMQIILSDGGASAARQAALELQEQAAFQGRQTLDQQIAWADDRLTAQRVATARQQALSQRRLQISQDRMAEMEQLLRAGRGAISDLGQEILNGAQTQVTVEQRAADLQIQTVQSFAITGGTCYLVRACDGLIYPATRGDGE